MTFWETLGIEPSADIQVIKRAYAARLKVTRPDDDAAAYQRLRQAYEFAQRYAAQMAARQAAPKTLDAEADQTTEAVASVGDVIPHATADNVVENLAVPVMKDEVVPAPARPLVLIPPAIPRAEPRSPASLVQATLQIFRERGADAVAAAWPSLQHQLQELPLASRDTVSVLFAQLVIENNLPHSFSANLARYFDWQTDFRVEQALGTQRAIQLAQKLALGTAMPMRAPKPPVRPVHVIVFSQLVVSKPNWWLWIFSVLAGAQLPGLFLSISDEDRKAYSISLATRAKALLWLQRGMLIRSFLVVALLAACWNFNHLLLAPAAPANLVLYTLPVALVIFYCQAGLAAALRRRLIWPPRHAGLFACALAISAAILTRASRDSVSASWSDHVSVGSTLVGSLLVAAAILAPPPSRRDTAQLRMPLQFVVTFLLCYLMVASSRSAAGPLICIAYTAGWVALNMLLFPTIRGWLANVLPDPGRTPLGWSLAWLALGFGALMFSLAGLPLLLKEAAARSSQRLVFAAAAVALCLPGISSIATTIPLRVLGCVLVLMAVNILLRNFAFSFLAGARRIRWWLAPLMVSSALLLSWFLWSLFSQVDGSKPPVSTTAVSSASGGLTPSALVRLQVTPMEVEAANNPTDLSENQRMALASFRDKVSAAIGPLTFQRGTRSTCTVQYREDGSILKYMPLSHGNATLDQAVKQAVLDAAPLKLIPNTDANGRPLRTVDLLVEAR